MADRTVAERMKRYRARLKEQAPARAEVLQRRVTAAADRLEREHPAAAQMLASLDPLLGEGLIRELNDRAFHRAVQRTHESPSQPGGQDGQ